MVGCSSEPVSVSYHDLVDESKLPKLLPKLVAAFKNEPGTLGILIVTDPPEEYHALRTRVLKSSKTLTSLPAEELASLECRESKYLVGWSHGRESLNGRQDTQKGSFYVNPTYDPPVRPACEMRHVEYQTPNIWPDERGRDAQMKGFKDDLEGLARIIVGVGLLVARACDFYMNETYPATYPATYLEPILADSKTCKARLLHYFPPPPSRPTPALDSGASMDGTAAASSTETTQDEWCGRHVDHGFLTGLTSAMYHAPSTQPYHAAQDNLQPLPGTTTGDNMKDEGEGEDDDDEGEEEEETNEDDGGGLYITPRQGTASSEPVKVSIPRRAIAFQTGAALELATRGTLSAVPHLVRPAKVGGGGGGGSGVSADGGGVGKAKEGGGKKSGSRSGQGGRARSTLAVFMQPNTNVPLGLTHTGTSDTNDTTGTSGTIGTNGESHGVGTHGSRGTIDRDTPILFGDFAQVVVDDNYGF